MYLTPVILTFWMYRISTTYRVSNENWLDGSEIFWAMSKLHEGVSKYLYYITLIWFAVVDIKFSFRNIDRAIIIPSLITIFCFFIGPYFFTIIGLSGWQEAVFEPISIAYGIPQLIFGVYFLSILLTPIYVLTYKNQSRLFKLFISFKGFLSKKIGKILMFIKKVK
jgi:hypothetical protein